MLLFSLPWSYYLHILLKRQEDKKRRKGNTFYHFAPLFVLMVWGGITLHWCTKENNFFLLSYCWCTKENIPELWTCVYLDTLFLFCTEVCMAIILKSFEWPRWVFLCPIISILGLFNFVSTQGSIYIAINIIKKISLWFFEH